MNKEMTEMTMKIFRQINPSRRAVMIGIASAAAVLPLAGPALALSETQATAHVEKLVAAINKVIASGKSESQMIKEFEKIFVKYSDVKHLAGYALGVEGRRASSSQKKAFTKAFQGYIARKYGKRFREFIGGKLQVLSTKTVKSHVEVKTMAYLKGQSPFDVTFFVHEKHGKPLFYNMYIEGINMLLNEQREIGAMLDKRRGNIDQLIKDLKTAG
ncbi:MlaC/ttg2D family ABC transporter substrate-binding protein [Profundibacter sp.]|uniref:MlaC/ttg2D family ABC transporter substrate-binding protein n=1 Tax=Profundibacter sp. TaxID=3101071 RepID=UPI003D0A653C